MFYPAACVSSLFLVVLFCFAREEEEYVVQVFFVISPHYSPISLVSNPLCFPSLLVLGFYFLIDLLRYAHMWLCMWDTRDIDAWGTLEILSRFVFWLERAEWKMNGREYVRVCLTCNTLLLCCRVKIWVTYGMHPRVETWLALRNSSKRIHRLWKLWYASMVFLSDALLCNSKNYMLTVLILPRTCGVLCLHHHLLSSH